MKLTALLTFTSIAAPAVDAFQRISVVTSPTGTATTLRPRALSSDFLENDLVAIRTDKESNPRLCVVRPDNTVLPLCIHEDDVETDLFTDPRCYNQQYWQDATDENVVGTYGEGWYGQRPVPSLGGGPGYGAEADEIWSVDEDLLENVRADGVDLPYLDCGIAHGEKARNGAF
jgi:hypothetical protein